MNEINNGGGDIYMLVSHYSTTPRNILRVQLIIIFLIYYCALYLIIIIISPLTITSLLYNMI